MKVFTEPRSDGFQEHNANGVVYLTAPVLGVPHAFTTRFGGVSTGYLAQLNLGEGRGDSPEHVRENYRLLGAATGLDTERIVFPRQVHSAQVRQATAADIHTLFEKIPYEADGLVTAEPGLTLIAFAADCVPVLLSDPTHRVCASVHAGWRGSVADILKNAVEAMCALGAERRELRAAVGPAIGRCCFEVGPEVVEAAERYLNENLGPLCRPHPEHEGKYLLDLRGANARRLAQLGLSPEHIAVCEDCTMCLHEKYWSHRWTGGVRGSQAALICLPVPGEEERL